MPHSTHFLFFYFYDGLGELLFLREVTKKLILVPLGQSQSSFFLTQIYPHYLQISKDS